MTKPNPQFHLELPLEVLRDTIIVHRPFDDKTEFQIIAWMDSSECGREAAKENAKLFVEAVNNYKRKESK
jgi:predicted ATPase with chaperone activity